MAASITGKCSLFRSAARSEIRFGNISTRKIRKVTGFSQYKRGGGVVHYNHGDQAQVLIYLTNIEQRISKYEMNSMDYRRNDIAGSMCTKPVER